jgi:hypothetical protein
VPARGPGTQAGTGAVTSNSGWKPEVQVGSESRHVVT